MRVRAPSVGPIVGYTTQESVRIFQRGVLEISDGRPRMAHGVLRARKTGQTKFEAPIYFKLNPNFDMTGVAVLNGLEPATNYDYQAGFIFSEVETDEIDVTKVLNWDELQINQFKTGTGDLRGARSIVTGSCRYALRMLGGTWFDDRGDKTFRSIGEQIASGRSVDLLLMCGDQIYADDLNFLGADDAVDEFFRRYQKVFTTPHLRNLMSKVPTYMMLDDHEIEDNWPQSANDVDWVRKFPAAIHAYSVYQASHSPLFHADDGKLDGTPTHLWYTFQDGCCDFFVCDTRTERSLNERREMLGPRQLAELERWLTTGLDRVKIIVTSVPLYELESNDKWSGYIAQRDRLLDLIHRNKIARVVVISGDVHASMASRLVMDNDSAFSIVSIVSSSFFWPYPHPKRRGFLLDGEIQTGLQGTSFRVTEASELHPGDCFTRIDFSLEGAKVEFFDRKGVLMSSANYAFR